MSGIWNGSSSTPTNVVLWAGNASILALWVGAQYVYIPYPLHLLSLVTAILYVACHQSLILAPHIHELLDQQRQRQQQNGLHKTTSFASSASEAARETLRKEDAYQFPIVGSVALFGLYLAFKYLDKDLVNFLIGLYFTMAGFIAMTITFNPYVESILMVPNKRFGFRQSWQVSHSLPEWLLGPSPVEMGGDIWVDFSTLVAAAIAGIVICLYFTSQKAWFLNNVLAISFCLQGVRNFSVGSFQIAVILLIGLFFYDIFWVFGTEVMVKVATNLDGPIKILLPRESIEPNPETGKLNLSLLGLGDIVIPGFFLALMLRFDFHLSKDKLPESFQPWTVEHYHFPKPYFYCTLVGYVLGLATTLWVMFTFNAAQPALLYLVPACLASSFGCALLRGEVKALLDYSEEEEEEKEPALSEGVAVDDEPNMVVDTAKKDN